MNPNQLLRNLQNKPYPVRIRILWISTIIIGIMLLTIWLISLKKNLSDLSGFNVLDINNAQNSQIVSKSQTQYIKIERVDSTNDGAFQIFFKINNPTLDILNFPPAEKIALNTDRTKLVPLKISDRQGKPFVQKILSKTENFGVLIFQSVKADTGTLIIDELYFEQKPQTIFQETLELNFKELAKSQELRN